MLESVYVLEIRKNAKGDKQSSDFVGVFSTKEKAVAYIRDNLDFIGHGKIPPDENRWWWWAIYSWSVDSEDDMANELCYFDCNGESMDYQPYNGYEKEEFKNL